MTKRNSSLLNIAILMLFGISGACGLIYEVVWCRRLTLFLGASSTATVIILTSFIAGLGLGAWLIGRRADKYNIRQLALSYVILEVGIGIYALVCPAIISVAETFYLGFTLKYISDFQASNILRLFIAFSLFIFPTILMGGTLPILSKFVIRSKMGISDKISRLYAVNTAGAVLGVVLAGYVFLPRLGSHMTTVIAAFCSILVGAIFWHISKEFSPMTEDNNSSVKDEVSKIGTQENYSLLQIGAMLAFAISGFAAMFYEVAWTRTLSLILGTTTYAFTTMLATFLTGIALGSAFYGLLKRIAPSPTLLVYLQFLAAFSALLTITLFDRLPFLYLSMYMKMGSNWQYIQLFRFLIAGLVMIPSTFALGAIFPAVSAIIIGKPGVVGKRIGLCYGLNTLGCVAGILLAGFWVIPHFGLQKTIVIGAAFNFLAGLIVLMLNIEMPPFQRVIKTSFATIALLALIVMMKPWSPRILNSGVYVYAPRYLQLLDRVEGTTGLDSDIAEASPWELWEMAMRQYTVLYSRTGPTATVSVMEREDGVRFMTIDGKTDASSGELHDMKTQILIGQLPLLVHENPDKVFVVGLGSGVTVGSVLTHDVRIVDCAEMSESVIEAAQFFNDYNHNALKDERLRILTRDARHALLTSRDNYDVIISQPSNPWINGQSTLFTYEWYKIVKDHLGDEGIFMQWVPAYQMSKEDVKVIIHTLRMVLPHVTVWTSGSTGDLILLAQKNTPLKIHYPAFEKKLSSEAVRDDIERLGYNPDLLLFQTFSMNETELNTYLYSDLKEPLPQNTDNFLVTEYSTPKHMIDRSLVKRFVKTDQLHGDVQSLMGILEDVNVKDIVDGL